MTMPLMPLGKVRDIVQSAGLDISYAYDDLVFSDHSVFIIRFDKENPEKLHLYFNQDCNADEADLLEKKIVVAGQIGGFVILNSGLFSVEQLGETEELQLIFHERKGEC